MLRGQDRHTHLSVHYPKVSPYFLENQHNGLAIVDRNAQPTHTLDMLLMPTFCIQSYTLLVLISLRVVEIGLVRQSATCKCTVRDFSVVSYTCTIARGFRR